MKIRPLGAELVHVDRRTDGHADMTKLIVDFSQFSNEPENRWQHGSVTPYNTNGKKTTLFNHDGLMVL
jgi:hypothetical protein